MSHHRFPNLSELFYGDLAGKIRKDIVSKDFTHKKECNYRNSMGNTPGVKCAYGGKLNIFYRYVYLGHCNTCMVPIGTYIVHLLYYVST